MRDEVRKSVDILRPVLLLKHWFAKLIAVEARAPGEVEASFDRSALDTVQVVIPVSVGELSRVSPMLASFSCYNHRQIRDHLRFCHHTNNLDHDACKPMLDDNASYVGGALKMGQGAKKYTKTPFDLVVMEL